jgi:hypothetical protein
MKKLFSVLLGACVLLAAAEAFGTIVTKFQTRSNWQNNNMGFWDEVYNTNYPTTSIWTTCPILAILQDPYAGTMFYDEFQGFDAATHWTSTAVGAGAYDIADGVGGYLTMTNAAADDDSLELQHHIATQSGETWTLVAGKPLWFEVKAAVSDATQSDYVIGLCITDTTTIAGTTYGVWFQKDDGDVNIDYHCMENTADTTGDTGVDAADNVFVRYGIVWDGTSTVHFFLNGAQVTSTATNVPTTELTLTMCIQNGEAVAKIMTVDYAKIVQMR